MINNKEMGVLYDTSNDIDKDIYSKALDYVKLIEDNSDDKPFELSINYNLTNNAADRKTETIKAKPIVKNAETIKNHHNDVKFYSATALSKELGISSKDLNSKFEKFKWIEKKNDETILTNLGKNKGAQIKKGQHGDYIAWPETIIKEIS
jgi:hypothetical protein